MKKSSLKKTAASSQVALLTAKVALAGIILGTQEYDETDSNRFLPVDDASATCTWVDISGSGDSGDSGDSWDDSWDSSSWDSSSWDSSD